MRATDSHVGFGAMLSTSLSALSLLLLPVSARAETQRVQAEKAVNAARGGPIGAPERLTGTGFREVETDAQVETVDGVVTANLAIGWQLASSPRTSVTGQTGVITAGFTNASLKASVPLSQGDDALPLDFKNVGNKGKVTIGLSHFRPKIVSAVGTEPTLFDIAAECVREAGRTWEGDVFPRLSRPQAAQVAYVLDGLNAQRTIGTWDEVLAGLADSEQAKEFKPYVLQGCVPGNGGPIINDNDLIRIYAARANVTVPSGERSLNRTFFAGAEATVGYNRFMVLDRTAFRIRSAERLGMDVNAHLGWLFSGSGMMLTAGGGYNRSYEPRDETEVCGPPNAAGQTTCIKGQDGRPSRKQTGYLDGSLRVILLRGEDGLGKVAMAPRVTYLFEDDAFEFKLPVYLQRDTDGGLDAGIQGIYNTQEKKFLVGAFIGVPFYGL